MMDWGSFLVGASVTFILMVGFVKKSLHDAAEMYRKATAIMETASNMLDDIIDQNTNGNE